MQVILWSASKGQSNPLPLETVIQQYQQGQLPPDTYCFTAGMNSWQPIQQFLLERAGASLPSTPPPGTGTTSPVWQYRPPIKTEYSVTSMILSISGLVLGIGCCGPIGLFLVVPGIIFGHLALGKIKNEPDTYGGKGMAIAGLSVGYFSLLIALLMIALFVVAMVMGMNEATFESRSYKIINELHEVDAAKEMFVLESSPEPDYTPTPEDLAKFLSVDTRLYDDASDGDDIISDSLGNPISINEVGTLPSISTTTHEELNPPEGVEFWTPYGVE